MSAVWNDCRQQGGGVYCGLGQPQHQVITVIPPVFDAVIPLWLMLPNPHMRIRLWAMLAVNFRMNHNL